MKDTRQTIIDVTIELFNKHGVGRVTQSKIAEALGISLGNLTYHFPRREDLVLAIYAQLKTEMREFLAKWQENPDFWTIHNIVHDFYFFQQSFKFFYADMLTLEREYPQLQVVHRNFISTLIRDILRILNFNVELGLLRPEPEQGDYTRMAEVLWSTMALWCVQAEIRNLPKDHPRPLVETIWTLLKPFFTPNGWAVYRQVINQGPAYSDS